MSWGTILCFKSNMDAFIISSMHYIFLVFLKQDELKSIQSLQPVSICCKEYVSFKFRHLLIQIHNQLGDLSIHSFASIVD